MSMPSWRMAPTAGGRKPAAANPIAASDSPMPNDHALARDAQCPLSDADRVTEPIEPVDAENDVGRFRRGCGSSSTHRDANIGGRESGGVVDAVADHDRGAVATFVQDRLDLVGG